ncbi:MAG: electron transfer flavoprotein subunit beta/FixA family protein [Sulfolobales archaeon]
MSSIAVLVKLAIDTGQMRFDPSTNKPLLSDIPLKISDIDRNALEEANRLRQYGFNKVVSISVLTWGPYSKRLQEAQNLLREILALGADEAVLVADEKITDLDSYYTAKIIADVIKKIGDVRLILAGEATVDKFTSQVPARVASELDLPYVGFARKIDYKDGKLIIERDLENYLETVEVYLPAVISVTREINTPKLPTLMQIRAAMKKPLTIYKLQDLAITSLEQLVEKNYEGVKVSRKGLIIEGKDMNEKISKLIEYLISEGILTPR